MIAKSLFNFQNKIKRRIVLIVLLVVFLLSYGNLFFSIPIFKKDNSVNGNEMLIKEENIYTDTATFGAGCFWCVESIFLNLKGVLEVFPGYMGGVLKNPTYKEVCTGLTGYAEVIQLTYNPTEISYVELLEVFFLVHNPTSINRQGADVGSQYRSVIFYHTNYQKETALMYINLLDKSGAFENKIVTEVTEASTFYISEAEHLNYYNLNKEQPYCKMVIQPKLEKFKKVFSDKLK